MRQLGERPLDERHGALYAVQGMLEETVGDVGEALSGDTAHWRTGRVYIPALSIARFGGPQGRCAPRTIDAITWESGRETRGAREGR